MISINSIQFIGHRKSKIIQHTIIYGILQHNNEAELSRHRSGGSNRSTQT